MMGLNKQNSIIEDGLTPAERVPSSTIPFEDIDSPSTSPLRSSGFEYMNYISGLIKEKIDPYIIDKNVLTEKVNTLSMNMAKIEGKLGELKSIAYIIIGSLIATICAMFVYYVSVAIPDMNEMKTEISNLKTEIRMHKEYFRADEK